MSEEQLWYLAGPMTGYPQFNFPAFEAAAWALRKRGYTIVSPHEEDPEDVRQAALSSVTGRPDALSSSDLWGDRLAHDVKLIAGPIYGLIMLPGWEESKGARLEAYVGLLTGKFFRRYHKGHTPAMTPGEVGRVLASGLPSAVF